MATIKGVGFRVEGLDKFRRELKKLDDDTLTRDLKDANFEVAQAVVRWAKSKASAQGRMATRAASTLRPGRTAARGTVTLGGARAPFAAGSEFGAIRNIPRQVQGREIRTKRYETRFVESKKYGGQVRRRVRIDDEVRVSASRTVRGWNQFKAWRGNDRGAGYWLFPAIRDHETQIVAQYGDAIERITKRAFPD
jgi:hypothetical protein